MARRRTPPPAAPAEPYRHPEATSPMRPDVGTQAQFRKKKPAVTFRYDASLSPALDWDEQNPAREQGERLIAEIQEGLLRLASTDLTEKARAKLLARLQAATNELKGLGRPFLNWAGKAERLSFDVPTLPLFVHERLSTQAIIDTLTGHQRTQQWSLYDLFADPKHSIKDQVLKAYEHQDEWVNRMILGDSLVVMNSLLHYENLGGQVQMIYMDPPYGIKYGSNFQPFVRKRDVDHNDDDDFTREPEMVQAYRDTWEYGVHSYLTGMRDRLLLCRDLLAPTGSIFVQISDDNLHHVRETLDEVFGEENFVGIVNVTKTSGLASVDSLAVACDYLVWYARQKDRMRPKFHRLFLKGSDKTRVVIGLCQCEDSLQRRKQMMLMARAFQAC